MSDDDHTPPPDPEAVNGVPPEDSAALHRQILELKIERDAMRAALPRLVEARAVQEAEVKQLRAALAKADADRRTPDDELLEKCAAGAAEALEWQKQTLFWIFAHTSFRDAREERESLARAHRQLDQQAQAIASEIPLVTGHEDDRWGVLKNQLEHQLAWQRAIYTAIAALASERRDPNAELDARRAARRLLDRCAEDVKYILDERRAEQERAQRAN